MYTEDLIQEIQDLNFGTLLPGEINTSIIAFVDDLILMSPTLHQLQIMIDKCDKFGHEHSIKFNGPKTQFLISGVCPIPDPFITLEQQTIQIKQEMKHLGFKWGMKGNRVTLDKHRQSCISDLWATTSSLISSGIRWIHPDTITNIFKTLVIPKMLYGIEVLDVNNSSYYFVHKQCRMSLKSLWGVSKHCTNDLNKYYNVSTVSHMIKSRKINFLQRLMKQPTTRNYLLTLLTLESRSFSILQSTFDILKQEGLDIFAVLLGKRVKVDNDIELDHYQRNVFKNLLNNWSIQGKIELKNLLEANIPVKNTYF